MYPRYLTPSIKPFNPIKLARETEKIVCRGEERKYTAFYTAGVYGGIATGYAVGCCLRCFYCWVEMSRDFPEKHGKYYSPQKVVENLERAAKKYGIRKCRISGGEPTLGRKHLLNILKLIEENTWLQLFILETNGILFGADESYVHALKEFTKVHVRVSLKAGNVKGFQWRTGAIGEFYRLPFEAVRNLLDAGVSFHVAAMTDPRIMSREEREKIIQELREIDEVTASRLEEEVIDPYTTTIFRLKEAGVKMKWL